MRLRGIGRLRAGGNSTDADAAAWAAAVTANGGTYSSSTLNKLSTLISGMKAAGLWSKMSCFGPMCGDQLAAGLIQYKGGTWGPATNVNFVSGDYSEATGLTGNGTTKYLNTGLVANTLTLNSTHLAVYNRSSSAVTGMAMGCGDGTNVFQLAAPFTDSKIYSDQYNSAAGRVSPTGAIGTPFGYITGSRTGAGSHAAYRNGSLTDSNATSAGSLPAFAIYVMGRNDSGVAAAFSAGPISAYHVGSGLTSGEVSTQNTLMQAFQTALGRNV